MRRVLSSRAERAASSLLVLAACAVAVSLIHREFFVRSAPRPLTTVSKAPEFMEDWRQVVKTGIVLGNPQARVHIVEFADLECPACRSFQDGVRAARADFGDDTAVVFVHFPLPQHCFASGCARGRVCARPRALRQVPGPGLFEAGLPWSEVMDILRRRCARSRTAALRAVLPALLG